MLFTLIGFIVFYSTLAVVDVFLMVRYVRMGPLKALNLPPRRADESITAEPGGTAPAPAE